MTSPAPARGRAWIAVYLAVLTLAAGTVELGGHLASRYSIEEDARQHVFWTYRYRDPALFPDDLYADFYSALAPLGYRALYRGAALVMDPLTFSKLLPWALLGITAWIMWRAGRRLEPRWGGCLAVALVLPYVLAFRGGLPRSFHLPLLAAHLGCLLLDRPGAAAGVLVVEALLYPQAFLTSATLQGMTLLRALWRAPGPPARRLAAAARPVLALAGAATLGGAILAATYLDGRSAAMGPVITRSEARGRPEFSKGGRVEFFDPSPLKYWVTSSRSGIGWHQQHAVLLVALGLLVAARGRRMRATPAVLADNVLVALAWYAAAHALLYRLHLPNRYTRYALPLSAIFAVACHARPAIEEWRARSPLARRITDGLARGGPALAALLLVAVAVDAGLRVRASVRRIDPAGTELIRVVSRLPVTARLAGPTDLAAIPLLARRSVYYDTEYALPYLKGYYAEVRRRRLALRTALWTRSREELNRFCAGAGVTHLVFRRRSRLPEAARDRPPAEIVLQNARYLVVTCRRGGDG